MTVKPSAAFPPRRITKVVSAGNDGVIRVWDVESGQKMHTLEGHEGTVMSLRFMADGRRILSAGADNIVRLWDVSTGKEIRKLEGHRDQVWHVAFSRDGRLALSSGQDNCVRLWTGSR